MTRLHHIPSRYPATARPVRVAAVEERAECPAAVAIVRSIDFMARAVRAREIRVSDRGAQ